jgi:hypothetical protein
MYTDVSTHIPRISLETTTDCVAIDPTKTALVVVDLQNYFLSPSLGRPTSGVGMKVVDQLLKVAIPACRKAGIPILWLNWGLTEKDVDEMPPTIVRGFAADNNFNGPRQIKGLGSHIGHVQLEMALLLMAVGYSCETSGTRHLMHRWRRSTSRRISASAKTACLGSGEVQELKWL